MTITAYPDELVSDVVLRDGSTVRVRPVRPSDRCGLLAFLEALSPESRWFRFFSMGGSLERAAAWAADVDYADRFGLVASSGEERRIVGHAVYVRMGAGRAEVALAVADDLHGRGVATLLLAHLAAAARKRDIGTFVAHVLAENHRMLHVLRESGFARSVHAEPGQLSVEMPTSLTPEGRIRFEQRDRVAAAAAVARVLEPASVALIGASARAGTIGAALTGNLLACGGRPARRVPASSRPSRRGGRPGRRPRRRESSTGPLPVRCRTRFSGATGLATGTSGRLRAGSRRLAAWRVAGDGAVEAPAAGGGPARRIVHTSTAGSVQMKIVVGYDGSEAANRALERAVTLAGSDGRIVVVAAAELHARSGITEGAHLDPSEVERRRKDLEQAKAMLSERGIDAETIEAQGDPGDVIVSAAKDADLVVVGSRGLNPIQRLLLGSVSSKVVHRAECDVLVVR